MPLVLIVLLAVLSDGGALGPGQVMLASIALFTPVALLVAGFSMRRRERQIMAIWELLRQEAEIHVPPLLENSDFERDDLDRAIRFLNNRGLDHYVWDRESDIIRDSKLLGRHLHVEDCDACGVKISLDVPLAYRKLPTCPYCGDPVSAEALAERKRETVDALRAEHRPRNTARSSPFPADFSMPIFLLLLVVCWPFAIFYAWAKWQG